MARDLLIYFGEKVELSRIGGSSAELVTTLGMRSGITQPMGSTTEVAYVILFPVTGS